MCVCFFNLIVCCCFVVVRLCNWSNWEKELLCGCNIFGLMLGKVILCGLIRVVSWLCWMVCWWLCCVMVGLIGCLMYCNIFVVNLMRVNVWCLKLLVMLCCWLVVVVWLVWWLWFFWVEVVCLWCGVIFCVDWLGDCMVVGMWMSMFDIVVCLLWVMLESYCIIVVIDVFVMFCVIVLSECFVCYCLFC